MENLSLATNTIFVGLAVVFMALIVLSLAIFVFTSVISWRKKSGVDKMKEPAAVESKPEETVNYVDDGFSDGELIAVLSASVLACLKSSPESNIRIKSFRRIPQVSPVWNAAGRSEQLAGKL